MQNIPYNCSTNICDDVEWIERHEKIRYCILIAKREIPLEQISGEVGECKITICFWFAGL